MKRCRYCGRAFLPPKAGGPGRTPAYCAEHRANRYRQAVHEGRTTADRERATADALEAARCQRCGYLPVPILPHETMAKNRKGANR